MSTISDEIINRVKLETNIVDVIGDYVRLRKTGRNWTGLCPFHDDKKPSFHVEPVKGIYKCFACGEGGNVYTFLMKINGWTFPESVRNLATQLGIDVPDEPAKSRDFGERERLVSAVRQAARLYHRELQQPEGEHALSYFRSRGFSPETIKKFGLGYSPEEWDWALNQLKTSGYELSELEKAGLVIARSSRSGYYDRFRGRAMFPIFDTTGRVVGFGARRMSEDPDQPKYINSPETPLYQKSHLLYGLFQAKEAIRKEGYALFVEGYADVISLHQAGEETAVATCGTAIAREHAVLISRFTSRAVLVFDSDAAGEKATERGIDVLIAGGIDVAVARLPDNEDPDTFIQNYGVEEFRTRIANSISFIEFLARVRKSRGDFDAPDRQAEAIRAIIATVALIPDRLKRELFVNKLATDFHINEGLMLRELEKATGTSARRRKGLPTPPSPPTQEEGENSEPPVDETGLVPLERGLVAGKDKSLAEPGAEAPFPPAELELAGVLAMGDAQLLEETFSRIDPEDFSHPLLREFINLILAHYVNQQSFSIEDLTMEELSGELRNLVSSLAVKQEEISEFWQNNDPDFRPPSPWRIAHHCLIRMQQQRIDSEYNRLQERLSDDSLEEEELMTLFQGLNDLAKRRQDLNRLFGGD